MAGLPADAVLGIVFGILNAMISLGMLCQNHEYFKQAET